MLPRATVVVMAERNPPKRKTGRPALGTAGMTGRIVLRTFAEDIEQLEALVRTFEGFEQPTIARAALRIGLTMLELEPTLLLLGPATKPKRELAVKALLKKP
jgi:hypothetical protein